MNAAGVVRGCGLRVRGGIYAEAGLSKGRIVLLHSRAMIEDHAAYRAVLCDEGPGFWCPKDRNDHPLPSSPEMCAGLWWEDIQGEERGKFRAEARDVTRAMPGFAYEARQRPEEVEPEYRTAAFASFPIHNLAVIRDGAAATHEQAEAFAARSNLPVSLEDA